jgi:hypothetical protein
MTQRPEQTTWQNSNVAAPMAADSPCMLISKRRANTKTQ